MRCEIQPVRCEIQPVLGQPRRADPSLLVLASEVATDRATLLAEVSAPLVEVLDEYFQSIRRVCGIQLPIVNLLSEVQHPDRCRLVCS